MLQRLLKYSFQQTQQYLKEHTGHSLFQVIPEIGRPPLFCVILLIIQRHLPFQLNVLRQVCCSTLLQHSPHMERFLGLCEARMLLLIFHLNPQSRHMQPVMESYSLKPCFRTGSKECWAKQFLILQFTLLMKMVGDALSGIAGQLY